ncbi:hypothetical protein PR202_gb29161 [Eleusine coracana subsp. coracana]|uniref:Uncharacterized protein n=1 Tax=Eleusine coracana subsp. coracana TaxID=191504 RepID=A0AAV5FY89_ELECO|nr:hypothetical protein PR202_gb29161 [Eleusine coracana subsp. coracana]
MPTDDEIDGIKAYIRRLRIARWPKGFKPVPIKKYDGQTNPREWLQLYSTAIRSVGGDSYVMANYLLVCLDPAIWIWLTSLPEESITSWGDVNRKLIESFQATCNRPGNHFDLTRRNHDLKLTAIADKFISGESALDDIRGKGKEKRSDKLESSKKDKKRSLTTRFTWWTDFRRTLKQINHPRMSC